MTDTEFWRDCEACEEGEHSECPQPAKYRGHPRGDNFEIIKCCCWEGDEYVD